jgi:hypothetical protein
VSNELSNNGGADWQPPLDDPGSYGAPDKGIDDYLACFVGNEVEYVLDRRAITVEP